MVHLTTGTPWSWRLGKGNANERAHLLRLIVTLPALALVIADAGFNGFDLASAILAAEGSFLIRTSSKVRLFVDRPVDREQFEQGAVVYWPAEASRKKLPPLKVRLIRVRGRRLVNGQRRKLDVWLLTNLKPNQMSVAQAAWFYRLRWENEGLFRTYKRTLSKVHLVARTVRAVHREAYGSLLSCQLLLAQGAWALRKHQDPNSAVIPCSARQALLAIRKELQPAMTSQRRKTYLEQLKQCQRERRARISSKMKRQWPQRTPHLPPRPPRLLMMNEKEKALNSRLNPVS